ncbi:hypothetical protein AA18890_0458 [Komagataeibacter europaeus LMG 18890]|nr:hypothetical protein AA18890_0458 [Komagataeibacter europaeus LMG 18890]
MRHKVQFEQKLREQAELRLSEAHAQIRSLTTRIGHADVIAAEHKGKLAAQDTELLAVRADLYNAREENDQLREELARLKSRQRAADPRPAPTQATTPQDGTPADEPEPVKWWLR